MNIFLSGATGVLGRRVVQALVAGGHHPVGLSRSPANADWLRRHGAEARTGNLFGRELLCDMVSGCDAVLHLATAIPTAPKTTAADWTMNDRIRREGTQNLIEAALRNRCRLYLQQSITFLYGDRNGDWVDERAEIPKVQRGVLQSAVDMERIVRDVVRERNLPAIILRFGTFYSHDSALTRSMFELTRRRKFPVIGEGAAYWNLIDVDDAASAVVRVVERHGAAVPDTFNVCDDEPVMHRDFIACVAATLRVRKPVKLPVFLANVLVGTDTVRFFRASVRCRNRLFRETFCWEPRYPTYREGIPAEIEKWLQA